MPVLDRSAMDSSRASRNSCGGGWTFIFELLPGNGWSSRVPFTVPVLGGRGKQRRPGQGWQVGTPVTPRDICQLGEPVDRRLEGGRSGGIAVRGGRVTPDRATRQESRGAALAGQLHLSAEVVVADAGGEDHPGDVDTRVKAATGGQRGRLGVRRV